MKVIFCLGWTLGCCCCALDGLPRFIFLYYVYCGLWLFDSYSCADSWTHSLVGLSGGNHARGCTQHREAGGFARGRATPAGAGGVQAAIPRARHVEAEGAQSEPRGRVRSSEAFHGKPIRGP